MSDDHTILAKPTQCILWEKPELVHRPFKEMFELLESYADDSHLTRSLAKCRECGQLYFVEWYEIVDWKDGNDRQYTQYIPVRTAEQGAMLNGQNVFGVLQFYPRLQLGPSRHTDYWIGK